MGYIADTVFNGGTGDIRLAWLGAICYTLQIYYDFSGYSDMAIGMGHMFGFQIRENFLHPYGARTIRDFWRRWHVFLSSWFREYLYIPLGGNRKGKRRAALNRFLVFLCTGIWHGANWTFVVWGLGHGLLSDLEGLGLIPVDKLEKSRVGRLLCRMYTLLCVTLLFVVFRAESLTAAGAMFAALFAGTITPTGTILLHRLLNPVSGLILLLAALFSLGIRRRPLPLPLSRVLSLGLLVLSILCLSRGGFHPFIYFQF